MQVYVIFCLRNIFSSMHVECKICYTSLYTITIEKPLVRDGSDERIALVTPFHFLIIACPRCEVTWLMGTQIFVGMRTNEFPLLSKIVIQPCDYVRIRSTMRRDQAVRARCWACKPCALRNWRSVNGFGVVEVEIWAMEIEERESRVGKRCRSLQPNTMI